ncbi:MAG: pyruvate kinase [Tepidiforma sp.]|nr:MAG: pyruvate kinase [Tepidiforma sp.]
MAGIRRTKIVATLGPASLARETLAAMVRAGMDVARLNTSHGTLEGHREAVRLVREVAKAEGRPVAVLLDLAGPKIRTGETAYGRALELRQGALVRVTAEPVAGTEERFTIGYPRLAEDVAPGERILLDDGRVELRVVRREGSDLVCEVVTGGLLTARRGVHFPETALTAPALTDRDREALAMAVAECVDYVALSFVQDASDLAAARAAITALGGDIPVVAKIERKQAVANLDAIVAEADGVMVARGDLGVELPPEEVPVWQRRIIAAAAREMVPVITATQMLESMVDAPRPTRAEASDVANAAWDYSDAVMLSGETAVGKYPVEAVAMMDRIIRRAEAVMGPAPEARSTDEQDDHSYVVALAARRIVESDPNMRGIACFTRSGYSALLMSKVHPDAPIFGVTHAETVYRRLALARGVVPVMSAAVLTTDELLRALDRALLDGGHVEEGDEVVVVASLPVRAQGTTNFLKLHRVGDAATYDW